MAFPSSLTLQNSDPPTLLQRLIIQLVCQHELELNGAVLQGNDLATTEPLRPGQHRCQAHVSLHDHHARESGGNLLHAHSRLSFIMITPYL